MNNSIALPTEVIPTQDYRDVCVLIDSEAKLSMRLASKLDPAFLCADLTGRVKLSNIKKLRQAMGSEDVLPLPFPFSSRLTSQQLAQQRYVLELMESPPNLLSLIGYFKYFSLTYAQFFVVPKKQKHFIYNSDQSLETLTLGEHWFDKTEEELTRLNLSNLECAPMQLLTLHELVKHRKNTLSQTAFAKMLGRSASFLSKVEKKMLALPDRSLVELGVKADPFSSEDASLNIQTVLRYVNALGFEFFIYFRTHQQPFVCQEMSESDASFKLVKRHELGRDDPFSKKLTMNEPKDEPFYMLDLQPSKFTDGKLFGRKLEKRSNEESRHDSFYHLATSRLIRYVESRMLTEDLLPYMPMDYGSGRTRDEKLLSLEWISKKGLLPRPIRVRECTYTVT